MDKPKLSIYEVDAHKRIRVALPSEETIEQAIATRLTLIDWAEFQIAKLKACLEGKGG